MTVDAVLFDLDETLVEYERPASTVLGVAFDQLDVEPFFHVSEFRDRYDDFLPQSESVAHLRELVFADIAADAGHDPALGRRLARGYADERDHSRVRLLPGAPDLLDALEDRPVGLVTNGGPEMQRPKLETTGLDTYFDTIVYAGHDTASKPEPEPFVRALEDLEVDPPAGAFVGNDPVADVHGSQSVGMRSVWLRNGAEETPTVEPDATVDCLDELLDTGLLQ
ncbi:HAD family hydrolase [Halanaeroarchaeum sulfurireducens]|uniref:HAD-superfamily hydrolase, subfamily IA, variant 1 n=1 Tax=Halanaeroarchaeum sulfurireducens TaxID=1604004 RepID=A0A0F7PC25_9EURY|nr:HAD family hydrolase [Halanaeroarchaeum sulfurireducens]AKH98277.1 HAD-superfamily hydrolase, subfamily IA, variant 1 [Halanaeroarchaeum sulfurireducens]ALG82671.1 HAD-superfamily hydrolase, subfamily IA, variant1 [Halanaeroarchaeum sulfurireducens]